MDVRNIIDLVLAKRYMLKYKNDMKAARGIERGISDHSVVL